nr:ephrin type-B receptor [Tanacetum cinerariifolium]
PQGVDGAGGGHGGRGAACLVDDKKLPDDVWGGDAYAWSSLAKPLSYGSRGGTTSKEVDYGGGGGGKVMVVVKSNVEMNGGLFADG